MAVIALSPRSSHSPVEPLLRAAVGLLSTQANASLPRLNPRENRLAPDNPRSASVTRVPLYHRSGTVALLDDDPDFVDMLRMLLPKGWKLKSFLSPQSCLNFLQQQPPMWEADFWAQQELVAQWRTGVPLVPLLLRYWATHPNLRNLTKVLVLDYLMPGRDGLDVLRDLADWPGHRVLLTGAFDETLAVDAFNAGLIDHFVAKQRQDLRASLEAVVDGLLARPNLRHHQIWSATLKPHQAVLLQRPDVADELTAFLASSFVEWAVIGEPFGALGLDSRGVAHWVQLESGKNLPELAELAAEAGAGKEDLAAIRAGRMLSNVELRRSLGMKAGSLVPARQVGDEPGVLFAAVTKMDLKDSAHALVQPRPTKSGNEGSY